MPKVEIQGRFESQDLGQYKPLADEFAELAAQDSIERELAELKNRLNKTTPEEPAQPKES